MRTTRLPSDVAAQAWSVFAAATIHDGEPQGSAWAEETDDAPPGTLTDEAAAGHGAPVEGAAG